MQHMQKQQTSVRLELVPHKRLSQFIKTTLEHMLQHIMLPKMVDMVQLQELHKAPTNQMVIISRCMEPLVTAQILLLD